MNNRSAPFVVKLGGSLHNQVSEIVPVLCRSERPLLVVPGGGSFAEAVRQVRVDDDAAHWMAIAAMDQYGWFIASQGMMTTDLLSVPEKTLVFLPYTSMRKYDPLPHSWDITSDTISAWIAAQLGLELLLLKSVDGVTRNGIHQERVTTSLQSDVTDPFFIPFILKNKIQTTIINGKSGDLVEKFLNGDPVAGTRIGTTF